MALALGFSAKQDFYAGDTRIVITQINGHADFDVRVLEPGSDAREFRITDQESMEVCKNVRLSAGDTDDEHTVRVLIEAPRAIKILRGRIYRREVQPQKAVNA